MDAKNLKIKRWLDCMKMWKRDLIQSKELNAGDTNYLSQVHSPVQSWIGRSEQRLASKLNNTKGIKFNFLKRSNETMIITLRSLLT